MKDVEAMLAGWQAKTKYQRIPNVVKTDVPGGKEKIETPDKENAVYAVLATCWPSTTIIRITPALVIANYILGQSGLNSRIFRSVAAKGGPVLRGRKFLPSRPPGPGRLISAVSDLQSGQHGQAG